MINVESKEAIFNYYPAQNEFKGIISMPHSGEILPDEFKVFLSNNDRDIMQDVDYRVNELIDIEKLQASGIAVIKSNIIRTAIDLNRAKEKSLLNWIKNSKGVEIVKTIPNELESKLLVEKYYSPYYEMLKTLIFELQTKMKIPSFIDLHSMPSKAEEYHLKINPKQEITRPDFCLSDVEGITCEPDFINLLVNDMGENFKKVYKNNPYFGGNVTRYLSASYKPLNNIQIEISRGIYMDENSQELIPEKAQKVKSHLTENMINHFNIFYKKYKL